MGSLHQRKDMGIEKTRRWWTFCSSSKAGPHVWLHASATGMPNTLRVGCFLQSLEMKTTTAALSPYDGERRSRLDGSGSPRGVHDEHVATYSIVIIMNPKYGPRTEDRAQSQRQALRLTQDDRCSRLVSRCPDMNGSPGSGPDQTIVPEQRSTPKTGHLSQTVCRYLRSHSQVAAQERRARKMMNINSSPERCGHAMAVDYKWL